jgi:hypothetical protein
VQIRESGLGQVVALRNHEGPVTGPKALSQMRRMIHGGIAQRRGPVLRPKGVLRDVLIVIAGNVLCLALIAVGTFVVMRTSSEGRLMREYAAAADDPAAKAAVINRFEDPWGAVMWGTWLLTLAGAVEAAIVGAIVGLLASRRTFWMPILSVLPLTATPLMTPSYATSWLRAAIWGAIAWAAATLVSRWRRDA